MENKKQISSRQNEITNLFLQKVDQNLSDLIAGKVETMLEVQQLADELHIHPRHMTNTIKLVTGKSPCTIYEEKILATAKLMIVENRVSISAIATILTYDPSNFTKFFKRFTGITPKQFRESVLQKNTEYVTI